MSEEIKLSENQKKIVNELNKLTALELSQIVKHLEGEWGVSAAASVAPIVAAPVETVVAPVDEKKEFNINLKETGQQKVAVIKAVKEITGLGLGEAKAIVDNAPSVVKEKVALEDANSAKKLLEDAGATVELT